MPQRRVVDPLTGEERWEWVPTEAPAQVGGGSQILQPPGTPAPSLAPNEPQRPRWAQGADTYLESAPASAAPPAGSPEAWFGPLDFGGFGEAFGPPSGNDPGRTFDHSFMGRAMEGAKDFGQGVQDFFSPPPAPVQEQAPAPVPALSFEGPGLTPEQQAFIDQMMGIQNSLGTSFNIPEPTPTAPPPERSPNPALSGLWESALARDLEMDPRLADMQARAEETYAEPTGRDKLGRIGQIAYAWSRDAEMPDFEGQDMARRQALQDETLRLLMAGFGFDQAVDQARFNMESDVHGASEGTKQDLYEHSERQAERTDRRNIAQAEFGARGATANANLASTIAQAQMEFGTENRRRREAAATGLAGHPVYGPQAQASLYEGMFYDPGVAPAIGAEAGKAQSMTGLYAFLAANVGTDQFKDLMYEIDPSIKADEMSAEQAFATALMSPRTEQVLRSRPELSRLGQYGGMFQSESLRRYPGEAR